MPNASKLIVPSFILLLLSFSHPGFSQDQASATNSNVDEIAGRLVEQLPAKHLQILVLDFSAPDDHSLPFGAYLADEFAAALAKRKGNFEIVDRKQLTSALASMHLPPEKQFDPPTSVILEKAVGANCVVRGSYGEFNGALGITINAEPLSDNDSGESYLVNAKVGLTPEMTAHLGEPLESLRPKGSFRESGKAGMTSPKCIKCPSAHFPVAAIKAGLQGTVELTATVTQEGRAKNIALRKSLGGGLDESAIAAVRDWEFAPALDPDGKPAAVRVKIQCVFHLQK